MLVSSTFGDFGATSPEHGGECSVGDFDGKPGSWEAWCDCMWRKDRVTNAKCKSQPGIARGIAPWTGVGAGLRGIPGPAEWRWVATVLDPIGLFQPKIEEEPPAPVRPGGGSAGAGPPKLTAAQIAAQIQAQQSSGSLVLPLALGGGVLFLGLLTVLLTKKKRPVATAVAGYRRRQQ